VATRHSEYQRIPDDFYSEPPWVADALFDHLPLKALHDPCCGFGTIVTAALRRGIKATGAHIRDRAWGMFPVRDFLTDSTVYPSIVTNPTFENAARVIEHGLNHVLDGGYVAALAPIGFLASQRRYSLFTQPELHSILVFSKRPSIPPGALLEEHGEAIRGQDSKDYAFSIWQRGRHPAPPQICWACPTVERRKRA
jgi:hypothetical protein